MTTANTQTSPRFHSSQLTISSVPRLCHPEIAQIQALAKERSEELGIVVPKFYDAHATMTAFLHSTAPVDRVVTATLFNNILYYIDDILGEDIDGVQTNDSLAATVLAVWQGVSSAGNHTPVIETLLGAVEAVRNDMLAKSHPQFFQRLTVSLLDHLRHVFEPQPYQSLEDYLFTRAHFGGMYVVLKMSEFAADTYRDDAVLESIPSLRSAEGACVHLGGLSNDLFSYPKERHSAFNLVNAYLELGLASTLEEAVQRSIELVNHYHVVYRESIAHARVTLGHLTPNSKRTAEAHIESLENILSATYHWQLFTERYRHPEHFFDDLR